ncbi:MAG: tRNA pseudouridine(55) synthase TruB [Magnetococcus sp. DMHC-8]
MRRGRYKGRDLNGWLVMHKPVNMTSAQAVAVVKRLTQAAKVGHGGTLDPFSEGLLPMALGRATKKLGLILDGDKSYRCWIQFGAETDSGDPTGQVTAQTGQVPDRAVLEVALTRFVGVQEQVPPVHSAIHVGGVRAYELARRGEVVEMPARTVVIHALELEAYEEGVAQVQVRCGKGTYMRALARDLGRYLGTLAHLQRLLRTGTLGFSLEEGITLDRLSRAVAQNGLEELLLPVDRVLDDIPAPRLSGSVESFSPCSH